MKPLFKYIAENIANGNIEKKTAIEMLSMLKDNRVDHDEIAIIGISVTLPDAHNVERFWQQVRAGVDQIRAFPENRKSDIDRYLQHSDSHRKNPSYCVGAYLEEIDKFDYEFFRLSPKEASFMDPNQRLFLQNVWHALEDAGYGGQKLMGSKTGVFVGFINGFRSYGKMIYDVDRSNMSLATPGNFPALLPSRISYLLDLKGPSMIIDTACSSSLVAVNAAIQSIRTKQCDQAIASGVRLQLVPLQDDEIGVGGLESSDGKTRAFDDASDGAGIGEGLATILLKPLSKALKDKDQIYAVIKGSAVNQDGSSIGITAPNPMAQADVITASWENAGIDPETISYMVTHGTGTKLGDPIEIKGIQTAFRRYTKKQQFCAISSVKSNIGHLYESSGIVSLIKAVLALRHQEIPPTINFHRPNREIAFVDSPVYLNTKPRKWVSNGTPRRCGVSSFGMSGTNCHLVLEEAPVVQEKPSSNTGCHVLTISAKNDAALRELVKQYRTFLQEFPKADLDDLCSTANTGRGHYGYRVALLFENHDQIQHQLDAFVTSNLQSCTEKGIYCGSHKIVSENRQSLLTGEITESLKRELSEFVQKQVDAWKNDDRDRTALLADICRSYVRGADVKWEELYQGVQARKISLPVYPFERNRCWLDIPDVQPVTDSNEQTAEYYGVRWIPESLVSEPPLSGAVLLFLDERGLGQAMVEHLRGEDRRVIEVQHGETFTQVGPSRFIIETNESDYDQLLHALQDVNLTQICHMSTVTGQEDIKNLADLRGSQERGFQSLFFLTRAIAKNGNFADIDLLLVGENVNLVTGTEHKIHPEMAPLFGLGRVVRIEHPKLNVRCLDIDETTTVMELVNEWKHGRRSLQAAYRQGNRYVGVFGALDLHSTPARNLELKSEGVYLITGGAGGIGLEIAKWMASQKSVNIALVNRTKLPERDQWEKLLTDGADPQQLKKIQAIQQVEASGSRVVCCHADVVDLDAMQEVVEQLRERFTKINGVIHAAGVAGSRYITQKTAEAVASVINPKIYGTWILDQVTRQDQLDFFIMFSSGASMIGEPGQGDYAAANSYLDSYTDYLNKRGTESLTINWTSWKEAGMSVVFGDNVDRLFKALPTKRAIELYDTIMRKAVHRVFIGELNLDFPDMDQFMAQSPYRIDTKLQTVLAQRNERKQEAAVHHAEVEVQLRGKEGPLAYSETEKAIAQAWHEVLGFDQFDVYDNFYEFGGDSVLALRIANTINQRLGVNVHAADLLQHLTIIELAAFIEREFVSHEGISMGYPPVEPIAKQEYYPLSSAQKRLYVLSQMTPDSTSYNISKAVLFEGDLQIERFDGILQTIIARHDSLRTSIELIEGEPMQKVHDQVEFTIGISEGDESQIDELIRSFIKPYDLSKAPQLRLHFMKLADQKYLALFDMHHIITDGAAMDILVEEVAYLYRGDPVPELKLQYRDYAAWQNQLVHTELYQRQKQYWLNVFADQPSQMALPTDFPRPEEMSFEGAKYLFRADAAMTQRINRLATETGTTLYMVLLAAYNVLFAKYSGSEDVVVGSPIIGRPKAEFENIIGMFVNTVAIRNQVSSTSTFRDFLVTEVKNHCLESFKHQDYPFEELVHDLGLRRDLSRNPLFDTMFALQNVGVRVLELENVQFSVHDFQSGVTRFDLYLDSAEREGELHFALEYRTKLFQLETVARMATDYLSILEAILENVDLRIAEIELASNRSLQPIYATEDEDIEFNF